MAGKLLTERLVASNVVVSSMLLVSKLTTVKGYILIMCLRINAHM